MRRIEIRSIIFEGKPLDDRQYQALMTRLHDAAATYFEELEEGETTEEAAQFTDELVELGVTDRRDGSVQ